jgi:HK97 family phage major capsid protein
MDRLLDELRSKYDAKQDEAERLLMKDDASVEDAVKSQERADLATKEMEEIGRDIDKYNESRRKREEIRANFERTKKGMETPNRRLPFAAGSDRSGLDTKKDDLDDLPTSHRPEAGRFLAPISEPQFKAIWGDVGVETKKFRIETGDSEFDKKYPTGGFKSLGHFCWSLQRRGSRGDGDPHCVEMLKNWTELQQKAPSGMFEESDPDGGDLIPRQFSNIIYERMMAMNQILPYLEGMPLTGNTLTIPALKEDSRADGSRHGGVQGFWEGEADQYTKSKANFRNLNLKLHKLTVLTYVTEELLMDSAIALESYLGRLVPREINFKINDALINGTGGGMPMGMLKSPSRVTTGAVSGQGASTIVWQNIVDMWMHAVADQRSTSIWLYNQDCESAIDRLYLATGTAAGVAVRTPNGDTGEYRFKGRPALVMEQCQTLGTEGDIILFCPEGYATVVKGGIQSFMSMHLRFDFDEFAYKWRFRMDAQPYDNVALTAFKGSNTYSSIVTLNSSRT